VYFAKAVLNDLPYQILKMSRIKLPEPNKYCIGIPTFNRVDLLLPALLYYAIDLPTTEIFIYDNGRQNIADKINGLGVTRGLRTAYEGLSNVTVLGGNGENLGVAGAWNVLCEKAFGKYNYALILNDDIYLKSNEFELNSIVDYMSNNNVDFFSCEKQFDWSAFLISKRCYQTVGIFDDNFVPAYLEDCDYMHRMNMHAKCGLIKYDCVPSLNPTLFRRSSTLELEPSLIKDYKEANLRYYVKKWGGVVGQEKYTEKFGGESKNEY